MRGEDAFNAGLQVQEPGVRNTDPGKVCIPCAHRDHGQCDGEWGSVCGCRCSGALARAEIRVVESMMRRGDVPP